MEKRKRQEPPLLQSEYFRSPLKDTFQLNRKSQISTPKSKQSSEHKFVRFQIKNLPHHDQSSLEEKRDFIVVFQTIQIQRLSDQVQTQRKKIRDYERKLTNAENYQIQIRQLTDQCNVLQGQITQYREQLQKMNKICEKIYHENDNLKQKLKSVDQKRKSESNWSQTLKQNKNLLKQIQSLTKQNKQLHLLVKQNPLFPKRDRKLTANSTIDNGSTFLTGVQNQAKLEKLSEEIYRLSQVICNKNSQIENLQDYLEQIKHKCKQYFLKNYQQQSSSQLNLLQEQLSYIRDQYKQCKKDLNDKQSKCHELQIKQKALENDLRQIEQIRKVCQQQQEVINNKMRQLQQLKQQQQQNAYMEQLMAQKQLTKQLSHKIYQYQSQLQLQTQKNEQNSNIHSRIGLLELTIQSLKADYGRLLDKLSNIPDNDNNCNWQDKSQVSGKKLGELRNFDGGFGYNSMLADRFGSQGLPIRNGDSRYSKF